MAPLRKSRTLTRQLYKIDEACPGTIGRGNKKQSKSEVPDRLGPQWSKEELRRFYKGYRKFGKDWKKVAGYVHSRSSEMVESLYILNSAYLSLPEGTASAVGLVAMMTDHYNTSDGSQNETESKDEPEVSLKAQKRGPGKCQINISKRVLSPFCSQPRVVGKRTPRVPVSGEGGRGKNASPSKRLPRSEEGSNVEDVAHGVLALNPQVSQTPNRRIKHKDPSTILDREERIEVETVSAKHNTAAVGDGIWKGSGDREIDNGNLTRNGNGMEYHRKSERFKKLKLHKNHLDDVREACNSTKVRNASSGKKKAKTEATLSQMELSSPSEAKKRSRQLVFEDESSGLGGLHTLADAIELEPTSKVRSDLPVQVRIDEKWNILGDCNKPIVMSEKRERDNPKISLPKRKRNPSMSTAIGTAEVAKNSAFHVSHTSAAKKLSQQSASRKRKHKSITSKLQNSNGEPDKDIILSKSLMAKASPDEWKTSMKRPKQLAEKSALLEQGSSVRLAEPSSSSALQRSGNHLAVPVRQLSALNQVNLPAKLSRRKRHIPKAFAQKETKSVENIGKHQPCEYYSSHHCSAQDPTEKISHSLSSPILRRWCLFEWFYSAIDYPWFSKREFVEYLSHVGLGHVPRLTRVEWGVIRSSLGKPRRLSQHFLQEEKEKLEKYRESVRTHYTELRTGSREVLPSDLALPLSVGQRVIALHPRTRGIHNGSILTVERNRCRVQFHRSELGVEFVLDIECMPLDPLENLPYAFRRHSIVVNKEHDKFKESRKGQPPVDWMGGHTTCAPSENLEDTDGLRQSSSSSYSNNLLKQAKGQAVSTISQAKLTSGEIDSVLLAYSQPKSKYMAQVRAKEADVQALANLSNALDKKELLLSELRDMNCEVLKSQTDGGSSLRDFEPFKKQYAAVVLQLKGAAEQVSSALLYLKQRNSNPESSAPSRPGLQASSCSSIDRSIFLHAQESSSNVFEVVECSRKKAREMVDVATQVMSTLMEGEDALARIGEALDCDSRSSRADSGVPAVQSIASSNPSCPSSRYQAQASFSTSKSILPIDGTVSKPVNASEQIEAQIPSALISSCVATLLMIQASTERQHPPGDAAQILDSAISSLKPCCIQNLPIYREIQMCMGMVKNQILALIPT